MAELGALFVEADLGVNLCAEHYEDHSDYLKSWIGELKNDYNIFFQAAADAEKAADRIVGRYKERFPVKDTVMEEKTAMLDKKTEEKQKKGKKVR